LRLIDCFVKVLALTAYLRKHADQVPPDFDTVRQDVETLLAKGQESAVKAGFSVGDFVEARFAVAAWIDETILLSPWTGREQWAAQSLQRKFYNTTNAGEEFFQRLAQLPAAEAAVREVFATCLALGFKGSYFHEGQEAELAKINRANLETLWGGDFEGVDLSEGLVFPSAYPAGGGGRGRRVWRRLSLGALFWFLLPPAVLVTLFALYRYNLYKQIYDFFKGATG
jgi:type VI secretion system protein ImpK